MAMIKMKKGFTLTEILIVVAISTFILAALYEVSILGRKTWLTGEVMLEGEQKARMALEKIARELRHSNHIHVDISSDNRSVRFDMPLDTNNDGFLDFLPNTSIVIYGGENYRSGNYPNGHNEYEIDADNNQLLRRVLDGAENLISEEIIATNINADPALSSFETEAGGTGMPQDAVIITITTEIDSIYERTIDPPRQTTFTRRVNLRN